MNWCPKCQQTVDPKVDTKIGKDKTLIKYSCPKCFITLMIDEYVKHKK